MCLLLYALMVWTGKNFTFTSIKEPIKFYILASLSFSTCICALHILNAHTFILILKHVVIVIGKFLFSTLK